MKSLALRFAVLTTLALLASPPVTAYAVDERIRVPFKLTVDAGAVARANAPVAFEIDAVEHLSGDELKALREQPLVGLLTGAGGETTPAQVQLVERPGPDPSVLRVAFVLAKLDAGKTATYDLSIGPEHPRDTKKTDTAAGVFRVADGDGFRDLFFGDGGVWRHMHAFDPVRRDETYKVYHQVYGLRGEGFITKGPGGQYTHHRGLFCAWNKTTPVMPGAKTYDFWHCPPGAVQKHAAYVKEEESFGPVFGRSVATVDWTAEDDGKAIVRDKRVVTAWNVGAGQTLLDWEITLASATGTAVRLEGDPQHAGFQFRAAESVQQTKCSYVRPPTAVGKPDDVWENCNWVAGLFSVQDQAYAVLHCDGRDNPTPTVYSTRDYGRFGAFFTVELKADEPLTLRYRVVVLDARTFADHAPAFFEAKYQDFVTPAAVKAERIRQ